MFQHRLQEAIREALGLHGLVVSGEIHLEQPANPEFGDLSTNLALTTAKSVGRNPRELAVELAETLQRAEIEHVEEVSVAGPGFINFRLNPGWLHEVLTTVVELGPGRFGRSTDGAGRRVNIEFVSSNPTGPVHAGHARGAVFGDTLAKLFEACGYQVIREFYINDRGLQMQLFGESLRARRDGSELPEGGYAGQYIADWAREMPGDADPTEWGYSLALEKQRRDLASLGVEFDVWFSERSLAQTDAIEDVLSKLEASGDAFVHDGARWLKTTDYGDDKDRVLVRSDGEPTYFLPDIAYHQDKFGRGFDLLIDVWGADHHGYIARMKAAMQALGYEPGRLEVIITQLVTLMRGDEEVRLSKRSGDLITLAEVVDEVGSDAVRFTYLLQSIDSRQTLDIEEIKSSSLDNPVYTVQYAHARVCSIFRVAKQRDLSLDPLGQTDLSVLVHHRELELLRQLAVFPDEVARSLRERAPHRVTSWLRSLGSAFHGFYHDCPILADSVPGELVQPRMWLAEAARVGLRSGLDLIGVSAPESM